MNVSDTKISFDRTHAGPSRPRAEAKTMNGLPDGGAIGKPMSLTQHLEAVL